MPAALCPPIHHTQCNGGSQESRRPVNVIKFERALRGENGSQVTLPSNASWEDTESPDPSSLQSQSEHRNNPGLCGALTVHQILLISI